MCLLTFFPAGNWLIGIANFFCQLIFNKRQTSDTLFLTVKEDFRFKVYRASLTMKTFWNFLTVKIGIYLFRLIRCLKYTQLVYIFNSINHVYASVCSTYSVQQSLMSTKCDAQNKYESFWTNKCFPSYSPLFDKKFNSAVPKEIDCLSCVHLLAVHSPCSL